MLARRERQEEGLELRRRDTAAAFARFGSPGASDPAGEAPRRGDRPHRPIGSVGASDVPEDAPRRGERPPHPPYPRGLQVVEQQWVRVAVNLSLADAADLRAHPCAPLAGRLLRARHTGHHALCHASLLCTASYLHATTSPGCPDSVRGQGAAFPAALVL